MSREQQVAFVREEAVDRPEDAEEALLAAATALEREPRLVAVLRRLEWAVNCHVDPWCPDCRNYKVDGHAPDCALAALLREVDE